MKLKFWKKKEKPFLVLDIGTEAIKTVIAEEFGLKYKVLSYSLTYLEESYPEYFKKTLAKNLEEVCNNYAVYSGNKNGIGNLKDMPAIILLEPENFKAEIANCKFEKAGKDKKISEEEKKAIFTQAFEQAKDIISTNYFKKKGILPADLEWLKLKVIKEEIDGYLVEDIKGYRGEKIEIKVLAVFTPKLYLDNIKKIFADLGVNVIRMAHLTELIPDYLPLNDEDAILIDVGGKVTQIFYIKKGKLDNYKIIEQGGADFSEYICDSFGLDKTASRQLKEDYADENLTLEAEKRVKSVFKPGKNIWKRNIIECKKIEFQNISIFFFGGGCLLKEIRSVFNRRKIIRPKFLKKIITGDREISKMSQFIPCLLTVLAKNNGEKNI